MSANKAKELILYAGFKLSPVQVDILRYVADYAALHLGNSPGVAEVAKQMDIPWSTAYWHLTVLSNKRLVELRDSKIIVEQSNWEPPDYLE